MDNKLTLQDFWSLIDRWKCIWPVASDGYTRVAWKDLKKLELPQIIHFKEIMDTYLDYAYTPGIWEAATAIHHGCSYDLFKNFLAWLIAQGKDTYLRTLQNPDFLASTVPLGRSEPEYEEFRYLPSWAYNDLTGRDVTNQFYNELRRLPLEEVTELRSEIHYAPWIRQMSRTRKEMEEHLPKLMWKTGFSGEPGWLDLDSDQFWGCDWQLKLNQTTDQSMQM